MFFGIKDSTSKVMKSFICRGCVNPVTSTGCTSCHIVASANLELVNKLCYSGDMLSVDGDAKETKLTNSAASFVDKLKKNSVVIIHRLYDCILN